MAHGFWLEENTDVFFCIKDLEIGQGRCYEVIEVPWDKFVHICMQSMAVLPERAMQGGIRKLRP